MATIKAQMELDVTEEQFSEAVERAFKNNPNFVLVVRCKDCKYKFEENGHSRKGCPLDGVGFMNDDDFCSYGERREGE